MGGHIVPILVLQINSFKKTAYSSAKFALHGFFDTEVEVEDVMFLLP